MAPYVGDSSWAWGGETATVAGDEVTRHPVSYVTAQQTILANLLLKKWQSSFGNKNTETKASRAGGQEHFPGSCASATDGPESLVADSWLEGSTDQSRLSSKRPAGVGTGRGLLSQSL